MARNVVDCFFSVCWLWRRQGLQRPQPTVRPLTRRPRWPLRSPRSRPEPARPRRQARADQRTRRAEADNPAPFTRVDAGRERAESAGPGARGNGPRDNPRNRLRKRHLFQRAQRERAETQHRQARASTRQAETRHGGESPTRPRATAELCDPDLQLRPSDR